MTPKPITRNTLFYGDNLTVLRDYIATESIDLIYLDPPFNSNRDYNVLFKDESGIDAEAQIVAFEDTWHWGPTAAATYYELVTDAPERIVTAIGALRDLIGTNQMMAYLVMMTARLVELHRVLKPTGSLYLHCDPTASHYLKVILDAIFGAQNFRSEIIWKRTSAHSDTKQGAKQPGRIHDVILFYTKSGEWTWNPVYMPYDDEYTESHYRHIEENTRRRYRIDNLTAAKPGGDTQYEWRVKRQLPNGDWQADLDDEYLNPQPGYEYKGVPPYNNRYWAYSKENMRQLEREGRLYYAQTGMPNYKRYLDEMPGVPLQDLWLDIPPVLGTERLGYPTQKPLELLERIIEASSDPGDMVLDPFCGCGTAIAAAEKLGRQWIGIDITHLSIALQKYRLQDMFPDVEFDVIGEPETLSGAQQLAHDDRFQFEWWALSLVRAKPTGSSADSKRGKKGSDKGIDGVINFIDDGSGRPKRVLVQVKSGKVSSAQIRDLLGTVQREKAAIGVFITLEDPTRDMISEAASAGFYKSPFTGQIFPRIQIFTIDDLLHGAEISMPQDFGTFKQAPRPEEEGPQQGKLL